MNANRAGGRSGWRKTRHTGTVDAAVIAFIGTPARPQRLVLLLPGTDTAVMSSPPAPTVRTDIAPALATGPPRRRGEHCRSG